MTEKHGLRALVVDDEKPIRRFLKAALESRGYAVFEASNGAEALENTVSFHPDVIILDLGLPDKNGFEVTREIRQRSKVPIIILSVRDQESDKIQGLDAGADDYLTKPFGAGELLARLRAVMRRLLPQNDAALFKTGRLCVDIGNRTVEIGNRPLQLSPTEYEILKILVLHAGRVVTRRQLLEAVWNKTEDTEGAAHLLRVTVSNLRDKIEPNPDRPSYILTEPGVGYRLLSEN